MDSKGLIQDSLQKNKQSIMEGGIHVSEDTEEIKHKESVQKIPDWVVEDVKHLNEAEKNRQEIHKEDDNSSQISVNEARHRKLQGQIQDKKSIEADNELTAVGKNVVKNGSFSPDALNAGTGFLKKIAKWAGMSDKMSDTERDFYNSLRQNKITDFLYVDGKPLKEFVRTQYRYSSMDEPDREEATLGAYAAMISLRQNHAITLIRPTFVGGNVDVDIRNLSVNTENFAHSRKEQVKATTYAHIGDDQKTKCENEYKSEVLSRASSVARNLTDKNSAALDAIDSLKMTLKNAGRGKHKNYDDFENAFNAFCNSVLMHTLTPGKELVDKAYLQNLYDLNKNVIDTASDYLKGKKMNLPRHMAVKGILDKAYQQSSALWGVLREGVLKDGQMVSLTDILAREDDEFVVIGSEKEIENLKNRDEENPENEDKYKYEILEEDVGLSISQEKSIRLKTLISNDESARNCRELLVKSLSNKQMPMDERKELASDFIKAAAKVLLADEEFRKELNFQYPYAKNDDALMMNIIAEAKIPRLYAHEFERTLETKTPLGLALNSAVKEVVEPTLQANATSMSYEHRYEKGVSREEFEEYGGASTHQYVTEDEADKIVEASKGFIAKREVAGRNMVFELVPSMPKYTTLYKGEASQKTIPLRKTIKTVFKTIVFMTTDNNGHVKSEIGEYNGAPITDKIDDFLKATGADEDEIDAAGEFLKDIMLPEMSKMLENEYRQTGAVDYKKKASQDAAKICNDYMEIMRGMRTSIINRAPSISFYSFVKAVNYIKNATAESIMDSPYFKTLKIDGRNLTKKEVETVLGEFKEEIKQNESEFAQFRYLDTDDEEMPGFQSCGDNAQFNQNIMESFVDNSIHPALQYSYADLPKTDPDAALNILVSNMDNIVDSFFNKEAIAEKHKKNIRDLEEKRRSGPLNHDDLKTLKSLYANYVKYEFHKAANICKIEDTTYTTETMAPLPNEIIKSPFTSNVMIGKYKTTVPDERDNESGAIKNDAMKKYYDHSGAFSHCTTKHDTIKSCMKILIKKIANY